MGLLEKLVHSADPQRAILRSIEWVIAVCTLAGGVYLFTPLYTISNSAYSSVFASALSNHFSIALWGILLVIGALTVIIGKVSHTPQFKSIGWFAIFLARFFQILTTILVQGFLPITWVYPFTIMCVVMILWIRARFEVYQSNAP